MQRHSIGELSRRKTSHATEVKNSVSKIKRKGENSRGKPFARG
jgi:hypothetical protein